MPQSHSLFILLIFADLHIIQLHAGNATRPPSTSNLSPAEDVVNTTTIKSTEAATQNQTIAYTVTTPTPSATTITTTTTASTSKMSIATVITRTPSWEPVSKNDAKNNSLPTPMRRLTFLTHLNLTIACEFEIIILFGPLLNPKNKTSGGTSNDVSDDVGKLLKLPVGKMIDSWGKVPERILQGNFVWLGAYDECNKIPNAKYCLVQTKIMKKYDGRYGTCMPTHCTEEDVGKVQPMFGELVLRTKGLVEFTSSVSCEKEIEYSPGFYGTVCLFGLTLLFIFIGTILDLLRPQVTRDDDRKASTVTNHIPLSNMTNSLSQNGFANHEREDTEERVHLTNGVSTNEEDGTLNSSTQRKGKPRKPFLYRIFYCFSLVRNVKILLSMDIPKGAIECINGIRAISMFWVILGHVFAFGALANMHDTLFLTIEILLRRCSFQIIANAYFSVDTFFVLSGLLVGYLTLKRMDKCDGKLSLLMYYAHRIIRITPPYLYVILFWNNIFRYTIRGPMAEENRRKFGDDGQCNDYWWTNLLYINNFYPKNINKECLGWSWYLANDMQFYIISPFFLYFMYHWERKFQRKWYRNVGPFCITVLGCIICIGIRGALIASKNYESLMTNPKMLMDPHLNEERQDALYVKPYTRISPYLIGLFLGYILSRNVSIISGKQKILKIMAWFLTFALLLALVYGPYESAFRNKDVHFNTVENIVYGSVSAFAWAITVAWIIYACHNGLGGYINSILSWPIWLPFSRLTFGAYLLHPIVIFYANWVRETSYHYQDNLIVFDITSIAFLSYAAAFILSVGVEIPIANLERILFKL